MYIVHLITIRNEGVTIDVSSSVIRWRLAGGSYVKDILKCSSRPKKKIFFLNFLNMTHKNYDLGFESWKKIGKDLPGFCVSLPQVKLGF